VATGTILVTWPAFTAVSGQTVAAGNLTVPIGSNGSVSIQLTPNSGATPVGTYYTAVYHLDDGTVSKEYWLVPNTTQTTITAIRSEVMPASIAVQTASQTYVNNLIGNYLPLQGGTMKGALNLSTDPQSALQAATKEYVDARVSLSPAGAQAVTQPSGTTLAINDLNNIYLASQYQTPPGTGNNGIANATAKCPGSLTSNGCTVMVDPGYPQVEFPQGYAPPGYTGGFLWPKNTAVEDYRAGGLFLASYDPLGEQYGVPIISGLRTTTDFDLSSVQALSGSGYAGTPTGYANYVNEFTGRNNTQNTFGGVPMVGGYGAYLQGFDNFVSRWDSGQTFGVQAGVSCHGTGDCMWEDSSVTADGGINRSDDEGVHWADTLVTEDPNVFTGTITGSPSQGATTITTSCTYGCATQGQDRLLIDTASSKILTGTFDGAYYDSSGVIHGAIPSVGQIPSAVIDSNSSWPVSTLVTLCYAGSDNGAGGAAGCPTNGTAPSGYIPPQATSPTQQAPSTPIVTQVMDSYPNIPSQFCTNSTLQSSNSGAACYMPASGVGCLTDQQEYETVSYTYNQSTQQITLNNLTSSHLNGMVFATGGLCGYAVEQASGIYHGNTGGNGVQSQVFPVEGTLDAHTIYYITQRSNEGYGQPELGLTQFVPAGTTISISGINNGVVTFTMSYPPNFICCSVMTQWNLATMTITTANSSYNGTYQIHYVNGNQFTYTPTAPTGTMPTSGTISEMQYLAYTLYPEARVNSVYDTANNTVDGTFYLQPNTVAWATGDPVREPHYPQMYMTGAGNPDYVTQFSPEANDGIPGGGGIAFYKPLASVGSGFSVSNNVPSSYYAGHGGINGVPGTGFSVNGLWAGGLYLQYSPEDDVISVGGCKLDIGCSANNSNFDLFEGPSLQSQSPIPGLNGIDVINYDPNYQSSTRGQGLYSGRFYVTNGGAGNPGYPLSPSYSTWQAGYITADWQVTAPTISASNVVTTQLGYIGNVPKVVGTTGSTPYTYWIVGHGTAGGSTLPQLVGAGPSISNGNATLSSSNYNQVCIYYTAGFSSYDLLKTNTSTALFTNQAFVPNSGDQMCLNDTGQSTTSYVAPTQNTTGQFSAAGLTINTFAGVNNAGGYTQTGTNANTFTGNVQAPIVNATSGLQVNGAALTASNLSNGTTGTGSVVLGTSPTITSPTIVTNIPNSVAVQHFTVTMCDIGTTQGTSCATTVTYPVAEPDTNYELSCMYVDGSISAILTAYNAYAATGTLSLYQAGTAGGGNYGIAQCILMHN